MLQQYSDTASTAYKNAYFKISDEKRRNDIKYIGEGVIFLLLIIVGAVYIYRSVRRQLGLQQQQQNSHSNSNKTQLRQLANDLFDAK